MSFGFGILDYFVVTLVTMSTFLLLRNAPYRLLVWLPTFLTVDFFIPLGTQLTPSRFVPIMLGVWLIMKGRLKPRANHLIPIMLILGMLFVSTIYSLNIGDAGVRPIMRAMHYIGLLFLFIFLINVLRRTEDIQLALWGLVVAGGIHGGHALYQLFASAAGLPYRGIVYSASSQVSAAFTGTGLRVNGLADEPKRLGYILFCGALAASYFALRSDKSWGILPFKRCRWLFARPLSLLAVAGLCLVMSLFTYSGSYFASVAAALFLLVVTLSWRTISYTTIALFVALIGAASLPSLVDKYETALSDLLEDRTVEFEKGLTATKVYRQEFFANEYVKENPASLILGLGLGRYNTVLSNTFGQGAGYGLNGAIMPLNSQFYELGFDLGIIALAILYIGGAVLALKVGRRTILNYTVSTMLLFLVIQTFFIESKHVVIFVAAVASAVVSRQQLTGRIERPYAPVRVR